MNQIRVGYFDSVFSYLTSRNHQSHGTLILDIGCGGGLVSEALAARGYELIGVDPSEASLATAQHHAAQGNLKITYLKGTH